jgi:hypothetical protein
LNVPSLGNGLLTSTSTITGLYTVVLHSTVCTGGRDVTLVASMNTIAAAAKPPSRRERNVSRPNTGVEKRDVHWTVNDPVLSGSRRRVRSDTVYLMHSRNTLVLVKLA